MANTANQHPSLDILAAFSSDPGKDAYDDIRLHLAGCAHCRQGVSGLQRVQEWLVAGRPGIKEDQQMDKAGAALKADLYYAAHSIAIRTVLADKRSTQERPVVNGMRSEPQGGAGREGSLPRIRSWLTFKWPVWIGVPVTATAVLVLTVVLSPTEFSGGRTGTMAIASYQDNPVLTFSAEKRPGIGFFDTAKQSSKPYRGLHISRDDAGQLHLHWQDVKGALRYVVRIYITTGGSRELVHELTTTAPEGTINHFPLEQGRRYEWEVSGDTSDERTFRALGGFLVIEAQF